MDDRLVLHTVHTDDGATEMYWSRTDNDFPTDGPEGSILFHNDGAITWKCWTDAGVPIVVHIIANRVRIAHGEDQPPGVGEIIFDSQDVRGEAT